MDFGEAVREGRDDLVKTFLDQGASPNEEVGFLGERALAAAANEGHLEVARLLIDAGADVDLDDGSGETALVNAARAGHLDILRLLIDAGADLNAAGMYGLNGIMWASRWDNPKAVQMLVDAGADVDRTDDDNESALIHAIRNDDAESFRILLEGGADVSICSKRDGSNAVTMAATRRQTDLARQALAAGVGDSDVQQQKCGQLTVRLNILTRGVSTQCS